MLGYMDQQGCLGVLIHAKQHIRLHKKYYNGKIFMMSMKPETT